MSILDALGGAGAGPYADLLTPDQKRALLSQELLGLGSGLLSASGPSRQPVGFGPALAAGVQGMQQGAQRGLQASVAADRIAAAQQQHAQIAGLDPSDPQYARKLAAILAGSNPEAAASLLKQPPQGALKAIYDPQTGQYLYGQPQPGDVARPKKAETAFQQAQARYYGIIQRPQATWTPDEKAFVANYQKLDPVNRILAGLGPSGGLPGGDPGAPAPASDAGAASPGLMQDVGDWFYRQLHGNAAQPAAPATAAPSEKPPKATHGPGRYRWPDGSVHTWDGQSWSGPE